MLARIKYGGTGSPVTYKTITFPEECFRIQVDPPHGTLRNRSASGIVETLNVNVEEMISIGWRWFPNTDATYATLKRNLRQWFQLAQTGDRWFFARDFNEMVLTTLDGTAAIGASAVTLASTAGVVAGNQYVIRSATRLEIVKVLSIASPVVNLVETLNSGFAAGDRFRSEQYWPARLVGNTNPLIEAPPLHYDISLEFVEDVNDL